MNLNPLHVDHFLHTADLEGLGARMPWALAGCLWGSKKTKLVCFRGMKTNHPTTIFF